ncbi:MAG: head fiber protein [Geminicoccaceae bacterium]
MVERFTDIPDSVLNGEALDQEGLVFFSELINRASANDLAKPGAVLKAPAQADSTAPDVATLVTDLNALLAKLRASGVLDT